jgi:hypothetical protein
MPITLAWSAQASPQGDTLGCTLAGPVPVPVCIEPHAAKLPSASPRRVSASASTESGSKRVERGIHHRHQAARGSGLP